MPSGITHILLVKNLQNVLPDGNLKMNLAAGRDFFLAGAVGPDLPYASIADSDLFFSEQSDLADKFHYKKTNQIGLNAMRDLQREKNNLSATELRFAFVFFLGYISHICADGIVHPFVRDKVGDYKDNKTAHRVLEMRLDVLFYRYLTRQRGIPGEFNYANLHDELENILGYAETPMVMDKFRELILSVYGEDYDVDQILDWIGGLHRLFDLAEGDHLEIYKDLSIFDNLLYPNYDELVNKEQEIFTLTGPVDRDTNFLHNDRIHFIYDCVPRFNRVFTLIAGKAYEYVYNDGPELVEEDIPEIDLDTGRLLAQHNDLDNIPLMWS